MRYIHRLYTILMLLLSTTGISVWAQPALNWDITIGGENYEELNGLCVGQDGIYIGGSSRSTLAFGIPGDTSWNILFAKIDFSGQVLWRKMYGGDRNDRLWNMILTKDGGLLAGGYSFSGISGEKTQVSRGGMDIWLIRMDATGQIMWEKTLGGAGRDELFSMVEMPDGNFILGSHSTSNIGGDKSEISRGGLDFWLIGIDANGNKLWDKTIGGNGEDQIHDLALLPSGHILASGGTTSLRNTGEVGSDFARGAKDFWILEFDPVTQTVVWNHRHGGTADDFAYSLCISRSGKIFLGGRSAFQIAPPTAINNGKNAPFRGGASDYWLLELDAQGLKQNEWSFGGNGLDDLYFIKENALGQLCLGGVTDSDVSGNKTTPSHGLYDFWVVSIDTTGNILWQKTIGGADIDALTKIDIMADGSFVLGGHSQSDAGFDKSDNSFGVNDFWIVTTACNTRVTIENTGLEPACSGAPATLSAIASNCDQCIYAWNTEATTPQIEIAPGASDSFIVQVIDKFGCVAADTLFLDWPKVPEVHFNIQDTLIAPNTSIIVGMANEDWSYQWSTGSTNAWLTINEAGTYTVTVTNSAGCTGTDQITVREKISPAVWAPNIFSPDLDGANDYFTLYSNESVEKILRLQVGDRWGELIFSKKDFNTNEDPAGWDGRYRGKWVDIGVYMWVAEVLFLDGSKQVYKGSITVVR